MGPTPPPLTFFFFFNDLLVHVKHDIFVLVLSCFNSTIFTNKHFYVVVFSVQSLQIVAYHCPSEC